MSYFNPTKFPNLPIIPLYSKNFSHKVINDIIDIFFDIWILTTEGSCEEYFSKYATHIFLFLVCCPQREVIQEREVSMKMG